MSLILAAALLVSCKAKDETDTAVDPGDTDTDCQSAEWFVDADADGFGDDLTAVTSCEQPAGTVDLGGDCDDASAEVHPNATEACNEVDDDCDGATDEELDLPTFHADIDADGFGDPLVSVQACEAPEGYVEDGTDCDDTSALYNPTAAETDCADPNDYNCDGSTGFADADSDGTPACLDCDDADPTRNPDMNEACNDLDDDCDGATDEEALDAATWFADADDDGFGVDTDTVTDCDQPVGYVSASGDCDDANIDYNPGATEACDDPNDYNCDGSVAFADVDADGFAACNDCDDADADVNGDAAEVCNGIDDDCTGSIDDGAIDAPTWYYDGDNDGFGDDLVTVDACEAPGNYVSASADCDDADAAYYPGAAETCDDPTDFNCDGSVAYADVDGDGFAACDECDDSVASINPDGIEACNAVDDDCDGLIDEPDAIDASTWYADIDGDGFGDAAASVVACAAPTGFVADDTDCDDANADLNPETVWYADGDLDAWGDATDTAVSCEQPSGYIALSGDCDDALKAVNPDGAEVCNDRDDDCDGTIDTGAADAATWYADADKDGYGDAAEIATACDAPTGFVSDATDCDDTVGTTFPGADETCNLEDDDCNGTVDDDYATDAGTWYYDGDVDGYGDAELSEMACDAPADHVASSADCDDAVKAVNPGATEVCDALNTDEDCSGKADNDDSGATGTTMFYTDADVDTYGTGSGTALCDASGTSTATMTGDCNDAEKAINPAATEICDALDADEDCDGSADDKDSSVTGQGTYFADADTDGYGGTKSYLSCDAGLTSSSDCNDAIAAINPGATEVCDSLDADEDCDGFVEDADSSVTGKGTYYTDGDADGFGGTSYLSCDAGLTVSGDCNDAIKAINPGATEVCDALDADEDCDGAVEDADSSVTGQGTYYTDGDGDTYAGSSTYKSCDAGYSASSDCDDTLSGINPGAEEIAGDSIDQDCVGGDLAQVGYAHHQWECSYSKDEGDTVTGYGWVYRAGVTDSVGEGTLVDGDFGYGPKGDSPAKATWTWTAGTWFADKDGISAGANDEYTASFAAPVGGDYEVAWRFTVDGGNSYVYGDLGGSGCGGNGSDDGFNSAAPLKVAAGPIDADGDGHDSIDTGGDDCNDGDETVYPGAVEMCDGQYNDCSTSGTWTSKSENGKVSAASTAGVWSDVTSKFTGTVGAPVAYAAAADATTWFCDGTYYANVTMTGSNTALVGRNGADTTILDGGGLVGPMVDISTLTTGMSVQGLTLTNGTSAKGGGGIYVAASVGLKVDDSIITANKATGSTTTGRGGGIYALSGTGGSLSITDSTISNNSGIGNGGGVYSAVPTLTMTNTSITGNSTTSTSGAGGLYSSGASVTLTSPTITGNKATGNGGGIYLSGGTVSISDALIDGNAAGSGATSGSTIGGGGVYVGGGAKLTITGSDITANTSFAKGAGIYQTNSSSNAVTVSASSLIQGNTVTATSGADGAGWYINGGSGTLSASSMTENKVSTSSTTAQASGAGLAIVATTTGPTFTCDNSTIATNTASGSTTTPRGGGAYLQSTSTYTVTLNSTSCDWGSGATANTPDDVYIGATTPATYSAYGAASTFTCTAVTASGECK